MKIAKFIMLFAPLFGLIACFAGAQTPDAYKTLRLTQVDSAAKTAYYVPTHAIIGGPGNATVPVQLEVGKERIIQGMIRLQEDQAELEKLTAEIRKEYGAEMSVKKELTTNVALKISVDGQPVWEHQIFSGSQGMPFQVMVPGNASAALRIQMRFNPASQGQNSATIMNISQNQTSMQSNGNATGSSSLIATFSSILENSDTADFAVEQIIEF